MRQLEAVQKVLSNEKAAWNVMEKTLTQLGGSVLGSDVFARNLAESENLLKAACAEVASLTE